MRVLRQGARQGGGVAWGAWRQGRDTQGAEECVLDPSRGHCSPGGAPPVLTMLPNDAVIIRTSVARNSPHNLQATP